MIRGIFILVMALFIGAIVADLSFLVDGRWVILLDPIMLAMDPSFLLQTSQSLAVTGAILILGAVMMIIHNKEKSLLEIGMAIALLIFGAEASVVGLLSSVV